MRIRSCSHSAVIMPPLTAIVFILLALKNTEGAVTPVVTMSPNWNHVLSGDQVTLSCSVGSVEADRRNYAWYKGNEKIKSGRSRTFEAKDTGIYRCSVEADIYSNPVRLHVLSHRSALRPVVTLSPNWNKVYAGEEVNLSCSSDLAKGKTYNEYSYYWYKNNRHFGYGVSTQFTAKEGGGGAYTCWVEGILSAPVQLEVVMRGNLILQAPPDIVEGDSPSLRCHSRDKDNNRVYYYMNNKWTAIVGDTLHLPNITTAQSDLYKCGKYFQKNKLTEAETYITVQDLFTTPKIKYGPDLLREGNDLIMTCDTRRNPLRGGTELHFAFYRDGQTVQDLSVSDTYRVRSAQLEDSGKFSCEVKTPNDHVRKRSEELSIQIQGAAVRPVVTLSPNWNQFYRGDWVTLSCSVGSVEVESYWYKGEQIMYRRRKLYETNVKVTATETYKCSADQSVYSRPVRLGLIDNVTGKPNRPVVTFSPYWGMVFENEVITMTCDTTKNAQRYNWKKDGKWINGRFKELKITSSKIKDSGDYQCGFGEDLSSFVRLDVIRDALLILQAPPDVVEGDSFDLRCHSSPGFGDEGVTFFYKDSQQLRSIDYSLRIRDVNTTMSGTYKCKKNVGFQIQNGGWIWAETYISVQDLFTTPKIQSDQNSIWEGNGLILTCDTRHNPLRENTNLHFAFYRDGRTVRGFSKDDTYQVLSAQLEDSGKYTCEVRTTNDTVRKMSVGLHIQIQELFTSPEIQVGPSLFVEEGENVTLKCVTDPQGSAGLLYTFYKDSQMIQSAVMGTSFVIGKAREEDTGSYRCSVQSQDGKVGKNSTQVHVPVESLVSGVSITVDKGNKDLVYGESLTLNCSAEKGTSPVFLWLHNEMVVDKNSELFQLRGNGTVLYIESLQSHHAGTYRCQVSNKLSANKPVSVVDTFQISPISENRPLVSNIVWPLLGVFLFALLLVIILLFVKRRKLPPMFPSFRCPQNQQKSEPTCDEDRPRDDGRSANQGPNGPNGTDDNQHLYGNVSSQPEEEDLCYTYIDIRRMQASAGPTHKKDESSVLYSVLRPPSASMESKTTRETDNPDNIYQNFNAERHQEDSF